MVDVYHELEFPFEVMQSLVRATNLALLSCAPSVVIQHTLSPSLSRKRARG